MRGRRGEATTMAPRPRRTPTAPPFRLRHVVPAAVAAALLLTGCPDDDLGEADETDPRQTVPAQSPALAEGGARIGEDGVGPSGGPAGEDGR